MYEEDEKIQKIPEYKDNVIIKNIDKKDEKYLEKRCFGTKNRRLFKVYEKYGKYRIDNTSAAGVIQLTNTRLGFMTKVPTHILYLLRFLKSEKAFLFDHETVIEIEGGENFFDIIIRFFIKELKKIIKIGLLPKYVKKYEDRDDLKGKLEDDQIRHDINGTFKFSCSYHDLTVDNLENQIILRALNVLIPMVRYDKELRKKLKALEYIMRSQIRLVDIKPEDFDNIKFDVSNEHYILIIRLSELILKKTFIKSIYEGKSIGFNFIIDMNKVFQDFLTEIIKEVIIEDFPEFIPKGQATFRSFIRYGKERPDIGLKLKRIESYPILIELKYKKKVKHGDKVQVGAYSISPGIPGTRIGCIISAKPEDKENEEKLYDYVRTNMMKNEILEEKPLLIYTIDLRINDNLKYEDFILKIKARVRFIISDLKREISL